MSNIWQSDNGWNSRDRQQNQQRNMRPDAYGMRRDRYGSPGHDNPNKRSRSNNWGDDNRHGGNWDDQGYSNNGNGYNNENSNSQPIMMTFKQFMSGLDDSIDHVEAAKRYNEYKLDFKRKQINDFFNAHKDEEWFRVKYHPDDSVKRKQVLNDYLRKRREVFLDLLNTGLIDSISIDVEKADAITKVLDSAVIKLEGGTDFDLKALDESYFRAETLKEPGIALFTVDADEDKKPEPTEPSSEVNSNEVKEEPKDDQPPTESEMKDKEEDGEVEDDQSPAEDKEKSTETFEKSLMEVDDANQTESSNKKSEDKTEEAKPRALHKTSSIFLRYLPSNVTRAELEEIFVRYPEYLRLAIAEPAMDKRFMRRGWVTFDRTVDIRKIYLSLNNVRIHDCEVGAIINRDLSRRIRSVNGIVSHRLNVLSDIRLVTRIVLNLDEQRKVWELSEPVAEKPTEPSSEEEMKDESAESGEQETIADPPQPAGLADPISVFGVLTRNPLLSDVSEYLIEEANAEEEELLGLEVSDAPETDPNAEGGVSAAPTLERDEKAIKVLDRLLLYLRIVHSIDYYNHVDYPNEDEMPNRIGIMHARGMLPTAKVSIKEVNDYIKHFEGKISHFLQKPVDIEPEELEKLGRRDADKEIEKFIQENTQEVGKDKWLCPLSGKKFKGPDFVRKHIENKHVERLEEVRKDTVFFNNYLADSKRPHLPEHPMNRPNYSSSSSQQGNSGQWSNNNSYGSNSVQSRLGYGNQHNSGGNWNNSGGNSGLNRYGNRIITSRYGNNNNNNGGGNMMNRKRNYRDLDAPSDDM